MEGLYKTSDPNYAVKCTQFSTPALSSDFQKEIENYKTKCPCLIQNSLQKIYNSKFGYLLLDYCSNNLMDLLDLEIKEKLI